jgi:transitional endoplasmic reticulum ATPase
MLNQPGVTMENFRFVLGVSNPSAHRETVVEVPTVMAPPRGLSKDPVRLGLDQAPTSVVRSTSPLKGVLFYGGVVGWRMARQRGDIGLLVYVWQ